jgi:predicted Zn finger-like uncharacterized protein
MPKLTRCTACGTTFRVTDEQLASHAGKVRCGACGTVFNAIVNAVPEPLHLARTQPLEWLPSEHGQPHAEAEIVAHPLTTPEATSASITLGSIAPDAEGRSDFQVMASAPEPEAAHAIDPSAQDADEERNATSAAEAASSPPPAAHEAGKRFAWWTMLGIIVATGALGAQAAHRYHHELTAYWPGAQPLIREFCRAVPCSTQIRRDAQAISIESSDLQADPASRNLLTLVALLRNRGLLSQDAPHLELTLTDAQDAVVARRILAPREYQAASPMAAGSELSMRLTIDASQIKASGYRLYAFYP